MPDTDSENQRVNKALNKTAISYFKPMIFQNTLFRLDTESLVNLVSLYFYTPTGVYCLEHFS